MSVTQFTYLPLDQSRREIRLLRFHGAGETLPKVLSLDMVHVSLDSAPVYVALSYTWGPKTYPSHILLKTAVNCEGSIKITQNLAIALPRLTEYADGRFFWIDAISINQTDTKEKSWQVDMMQSIYKTATSVFIWLGPDFDDGSKALQSLDRVGQDLCEQPDIFEWEAKYWFRTFWAHHYALGMPPPDGENIERVLNKYDISDASGSALPLTPIRRLLERSWWQRVWVLQEIVLPAMESIDIDRNRRLRRIVFACGNARSSLYHVAPALTFLRLKLLSESGRLHNMEDSDDWFLFFDHSVKGTSQSTYFLDARPFVMISARVWVTRVPLCTLLLSTSAYTRADRRFGASDPRDRVYALLGISRDAEELQIKPDYNKTCREVYIQVAAAFIKSSEIDIILHAHSPKAMKTLPSWVPDWTAESQSHLMHFGENQMYENGFHKFLCSVEPHFCPWKSKDNETKDTFVDEAHGTLRVRGIAIATVHKVMGGSSWHNYLATVAQSISSPGGLTPKPMYNQGWRPSKTEAEFESRKCIRQKLLSKPVVFMSGTQHDPAIREEVDKANSRFWTRFSEAADLGPHISWEVIDNVKMLPLIEAIASVHTELRSLCRNSKLKPPVLEDSIWRTLVADQWEDENKGYFRPNPHVRNAIIGFSIYTNSAGSAQPDGFSGLLEQARKEFMHHTISTSGLFEEELSIEEVEHVLQSSKNSMALAVVKLNEELRMVFCRQQSDGTVQLGTYLKRFDELAVVLHIRGALQDQRFATRKSVARGLCNGTLDHQEISDAAHAEIGKMAEPEPADVDSMIWFGVMRYAKETLKIAIGRRPFATSCGRPGTGPHDLLPGDQIVALAGLSALVALRRVEGTDSYTFVGEVYVHGAMDGELAKGSSVTTFTIQ